MNFDIIKALHIIFLVSWFAGLFYMVRLFIYTREAQDKDATAREILTDQLTLMQSRLWWIITTPAMVLTVVFGSLMLYINPAYLKMPWMHMKLGFVVLLLAYHFYSQRIMFQQKAGVYHLTTGKLRLWNEVATLFLVAIVFLVVLKNTMNWIYGTIGFFAIGVLLMVGIKFYKSVRNRAENK